MYRHQISSAASRGERTSELLEKGRARQLKPSGFTGAYQFQDGTVHLNHRFHSTFTLGFTQPDPSRQEMNNYAYAACDPINNTDPTGLQTYGECMVTNVVVGFSTAGIVGAVWGGVSGGVGGSVLGPAGTFAGVVGGASVGTLSGVAQGFIGGAIAGVLLC
ncbi:RHS repeat-associated core domain-containing protein [Nocardiopsis dassonvillei]|uniref:RHS repeat-associated core domain-containing protein n=1 Tax=Nocardiopsis dassonvillei TaxID=2014 RepID=UPI0036701AC6